MAKLLTLKFKNPSLQQAQELHPKLRVQDLIKDSYLDLDGFGTELLNEIYKSTNEVNNQNGRFTILGMKKNRTGTLQYGSPLSLGLSKEGHTQAIDDFGPALSGPYKNKSLRDVIEMKVPLTSGKIDISHLPDVIKGQMRYDKTISLSMESVMSFSSISTFTGLQTNSELKKGLFVITSTEGFIKFDSSNKPYIESEYKETENVVEYEGLYEFLNWINGSDTGEDIGEALEWNGDLDSTEPVEALTWEDDASDELYLTAGTFIIFIERKAGVNYFAFIKRDVRSSTEGRYGMVKLSNILSTYPNPTRNDLSNTKSSEKIITAEILSKLGFDITYNSGAGELLFESFE